MGSRFYTVLRVMRVFLPFIGRELREQYAGSWLGAVWSLVQPLLFILLYWWVFAAVLRTRFPEHSALANTPFIAFLLSALLPWFAVQEGLNRAASSILNRREVVRKVHFPVRVFPLAATGAACLVHGLSYSLFLVGWTVWLDGGAPIPAFGAALLVFFLQSIVTGGAGLLLAALTVYLRDLQQVLTLVLVGMFYTAPILYPLEMAPENLHGWIRLNPFTGFAEAYHRAVLLGAWPELQAWMELVLLALVTIGVGAYCFQRLEPGFADVL